MSILNEDIVVVGMLVRGNLDSLFAVRELGL